MSRSAGGWLERRVSGPNRLGGVSGQHGIFAAGPTAGIRRILAAAYSITPSQKNLDQGGVVTANTGCTASHPSSCSGQSHAAADGAHATATLFMELNHMDARLAARSGLFSLVTGGEPIGEKWGCSTSNAGQPPPLWRTPLVHVLG